MKVHFERGATANLIAIALEQILQTPLLDNTGVELDEVCLSFKLLNKRTGKPLQVMQAGYVLDSVRVVARDDGDQIEIQILQKRAMPDRRPSATIYTLPSLAERRRQAPKG